MRDAISGINAMATPLFSRVDVSKCSSKKRINLYDPEYVHVITNNLSCNILGHTYAKP